MKKFDSSAKSQRARLLARLKQGPVTTLEARHSLDILGVAPRIFSLKNEYGFNIQTCWDNGDNPGGGRHRIAKYVLLPGKYQGGKNNE